MSQHVFGRRFCLLARVILLIPVLTIVATATSFAQPVITSPASGAIFRAGPDYATDILNDPWDFNNNEDISPSPDEFFGWSTTQLASKLVNGTGPTFISNGAFRGAAEGDNQLMLLYRADAIALNPGRTGARFPINTSLYRKFAMKISYTNATGSSAGNRGQPVVFWYHSSYAETNERDRTGGAIFGDIPGGNSTLVNVLDLSTVTAANGLISAGGNVAAPFTAETFVKGFRIDPTTKPEAQGVVIDWVRLTASDNQSHAAIMPVTLTNCSGSSTLIVTDSTGTAFNVVENGSPTTPNFNYGILPPGTYTLTARCGSQSSQAVSFIVNNPPAVTVIDPDEIGDPDTDYAAILSNGSNRWDFEQLTDAARLGNASTTQGACASGGCGIIASPRGGNMLRASSVGTSASELGDPQVEFLDGTTNPISSRRHKFLTFSIRINEPYSTLNGSVARILWGSRTFSDLTSDTTSQDMRVWPGLNTYTIDLSALTAQNGGIETDCVIRGCPTTPWQERSIRYFRIDPHEFGEDLITRQVYRPVSFDLDDVSLTAPDEVNLSGSGAGSSFTIRYSVSDTDTAGSSYSTRIFLDTDRDPLSGLIEITTSPITAAPGPGQFVWTPPVNFTPATYFVYVQTTESRSGFSNVQAAYSTGPLVVYSATATSPVVTLNSPSAGTRVPFPFTITGCAYDQGNTSGINMDEVAVFAIAGTGVNGVAPGTTFALGFGSGLGVLQYGPLTGANVPCDTIANTSSPFRNSGYRVADIGLASGPWTLRTMGRSTISGILTRIANDVPIIVSQLVLGPRNFQVTATGNAVTVSFDAPEGGPQIGGYVIEVATNPDFNPTLASQTVATAGTHGPAALPNGTFFFRVVTLSPSGSRGDASPTRQITLPAGGAPAPGPPVLTATQVTSNPVTLSWAAGPGGAPTSYTIIAGSTPGGSEFATVPLGLQTSITAAIPIGRRLYVRIVATNSAGSATSNEINFQIGGANPPGPPVLTATQVTTNPVTISWAPGPGGAPEGYTALAGTTPGGTQLGIFQLGSLTSVTAPVPVGVRLYIRIQANNAAGTAISNEINFQVAGPSPPDPQR